MSAITKHFKAVNWGSVGSAIISGIAKGITSGISTIVNAAKEAASSALKAAKNFLGIHSPSRVFRSEVGEMMSLGMAEGITDGKDAVSTAINDLTNASVNSIDTGLNITGENYTAKAQTENLLTGLTGLLGSGQGTYTINLNVDGKTLASVLFDPLEKITMQRRVAVG